MASYVLKDYRCAVCGVIFESLEERGQGALHCGAGAIPVMSAVRGRVKLASVDHGHRGAASDRPPGALDTRGLADGMTVSDWRHAQTRGHLDRRYRQIKGTL